jgi:hypothetical protein
MPASVLLRSLLALLSAAVSAAAAAETQAPAATAAETPVVAPRVNNERWIFGKMDSLVVGYNDQTRFALDGEVFAHVLVRLPKPGSMSGITYQFALFKGTYNCAARTYQRQSLQVFGLDGASVGAGADVDQMGRPVADDPVQRFFLGLFCGEAALTDAQEVMSFSALIEAANRLAVQ